MSNNILGVMQNSYEICNDEVTGFSCNIFQSGEYYYYDHIRQTCMHTYMMINGIFSATKLLTVSSFPVPNALFCSFPPTLCQYF